MAGTSLQRPIGVGPALEKARRIRGLSLDEAARDTRLRVDQLTALEAEDFEALPSDAFVRGALRTYAQYLGVRPEKVLEAYGRHADDPAPPPPPAGLGRIERAIAATRIRDNQRFLLFGAATVLVLLLLFGLLSGDSGAPPPAALPTTTSPTVAGSATIDAVLVAQRPVEVTVTVDGATETYAMEEGETLLLLRLRGARGGGRPTAAPCRSRSAGAISERRGSPARRGREPSRSTTCRRPPRRCREPGGAGRGRRCRHGAAARPDREHERPVDRGAAWPRSGPTCCSIRSSATTSTASCRCSSWPRREPTSCSSPEGSGRPRTTSPAMRSRRSWACRSSAMPRVERWLLDRFAGFSSGPMPSNNLRQADVPRGARTIENDRGSAPGLVADLPERCPRLCDAGRARRDAGDDARHRAAGAGRAHRGGGRALPHAAMRRHRRVEGGGDPHGPLRRLGEPLARLPGIGGRGEGAAHREGRLGGARGGDDRAARDRGAPPPRRRRVLARRRDARAGGVTVAARVATPARLRRVAHGWQRGRAHDRGRGSLEGLRRLGGRLHGGGQAARARCLARRRSRDRAW